MRMLRLICQLRGYHNATWIIDRFEKEDLLGGITVRRTWGTAGTCRTCGAVHPKGTYENESTVIEWPV